MNTTLFGAMSEIQVIVTGVGPHSISLRLSQDASVDRLHDGVVQTTKALSSDICIVHGVKRLEHGKKLTEYGIVDGSMLAAWVRSPGGWNPLDKIRIKKIELTALEGYITLTHEEDMLGLDDDPDTKRAKMPCGHVIGPSSMTSYCKSLLSEKKYQFFCPDPSCETEWPFFLVRHVACLSPSELQEIEKNLGNNFLEMAEGAKQCPGCNSWCVRIDKSIRIQCLYCRKHRKGQSNEFCWNCKNPWTWGGTEVCRSSVCDERLQTLKVCSLKEVVGVQCPSTRACPRCYTLIEHTEACKHMQCLGCKKHFCFICLSLQSDKGSYPCGSFNTRCNVAPRQTKLY